MIGENHARARRTRDIDEPFRNGCGARMQVHDARPHLCDDCPEALGRDLVRHAIGEFEPRSHIAREAIDRQAAVHISGRRRAGGRDGTRISARGKPLCQSAHIDLRAAAGVGKIGVGNVEDVRYWRLPQAGPQVRSKSRAEAVATMSGCWIPLTH